MKQQRLTIPYKGDDIATFNHNTKYHRTSSEAFRDAEYACAVSHNKSVKRDMMEFGFMAVAIIGLFITLKYVIMYYK